jgi:UDP-N-acetylmuramoyl-tripeptide--D-alanyl-D-alanine ligase
MNSAIDRLFIKLTPPYLSFWASRVLRAHNPRVVGITGSVGKTTTKDMIAAALMHPDAVAMVGRVWKTPGNMNNNVGVPLTVLGYKGWAESAAGWLKLLASVPFRSLRLVRSSDYAEVLVLEYAAGWDGSVPHLARLAPPTVAVVTAIGPSHLERFGTVDGVAEEKSALVKAVPASGLVVLGADTPGSANMARLSAAPVRLVPGRGRDLSAEAARIVARYFGVPDDVIERALSTAVQTARRLETIRVGSLTLIDDSFNANPLSMKFALDSLSQMAVVGERRVAVLGDMKELGVATAHYHDEIAEYARERADLVIGVGSSAKAYRGAHWFPNAKSCSAHVHELIRAGDCILVKGSHSVRLRRVVGRIKELSDSGAY